MLHVKPGKEFDWKADWLVNPVNCQGVMGGGLAKEFKIRFPQVFSNYKIACAYGPDGNLVDHLGDLNSWTSCLKDVGDVWEYTISDKHLIVRPSMIFHIATKKFWRQPCTLESVERGLIELRRQFSNLLSDTVHHNTWISIPALGCGLGGLSFDRVEPLIRQHLGDLPLNMVLYRPILDKK